MQLLFYILELTCHITKISLIFRYLLNLHVKSTRNFIIITALTEVGLALIHFSNAPSIVRSFYILFFAPILLYVFTISDSLKTIIGYTILCSFLVGGIDTLTADVLYTTGKLLNTDFHKMLVGTLVSFLTVIYWSIMVYYINKKYMNHLSHRQTHFFVFISFASFFNSGIYMIFRNCIYGADFADYANTNFIQWALIMFGIALIAEITYILYLYHEKTHYSIVHDFTQEYLEIKKAHFEEIQLRDKETRMFRHDIQGHLSIINNYANEKNWDKLTQYLHSINNALTSIRPKYSTGNEIIDSILNQKQTLLEENQIELKLRGNNLSELNDMDEFDLCTIFTNAIQNAIEACMQIPPQQKRQIKVQLESNATVFVLEFSNTVKENLKIKNNTIATNKKDKENHGFGLVQIKQVILNHQGDIFYACENKIFKLILHIPKETMPHD